MCVRCTVLAFEHGLLAVCVHMIFRTRCVHVCVYVCMCVCVRVRVCVNSLMKYDAVNRSLAF